MNTDNRGRTKHDVVTAGIWAALLLLLLGATIEAAVAQNALSSVQKLTLTGAVDLALKQNLDIQIANIDSASEQQERVIARSALLPKAGFVADDAVTRYNTKAVLGIEPAIIPHNVGRFQAVHIGPTFKAPIFDLTLIRQYQASGHYLLASRADEQTVHEETVLLAVSEYMSHLRTLASISAAQSRVELADRLAHPAQDLLTDGVASNIDVSRAQVRLREEQQRLVDDQRDVETTQNALKRILNMQVSEQIEFTDQQDFFSTPSLEFSDPLSTALQQRPNCISRLRASRLLN